ncbi:MAG: response regulator [Desulfobacterales bacterium]|nr:response regulator [Desulfobacterales bacterium]MCP4160852.1 response regulator [Deltaproteobacteria bacterium]
MNNKIVIVDDEVHILKSLKRLFIDDNYEIFTFNDPKNALKKIAEIDPALIISDQRMPEMEGTDFLKETIKYLPDTVRIILTGYSDYDAAVSAINDADVYRFISKPWNEKELTHTVKKALQHFNIFKENIRLQKLVEKQNMELVEHNKNLEKKVKLRTEKISSLLTRIEKSMFQLVDVFSNFSEIFNPEIGSHSKRVAKYSKLIGEKLKIEGRDLENVIISALLHDIGLIGIPSEILKKEESKLKKQELALIKQHPSFGYTLFSSIESFDEIISIIYLHHENYNGTGYPENIKGKDIPIGAAILRIADSYDNMVIKKKLQPEKALELLIKGRGVEFDPEVVDAAIDVFQTMPLLFERETAIQFDQLRVGMVLSRNLKTNSDRLLIPENIKINEIVLEKLKNFHRIEPITSHVYIRTGSK